MGKRILPKIKEETNYIVFRKEWMKKIKKI